MRNHVIEREMVEVVTLGRRNGSVMTSGDLMEWKAEMEVSTSLLAVKGNGSASIAMLQT